MKKNGMTIIELLAVIFLVGLIFGVGFPTFFRFTESPLLLEGTRLSNLLQDAGYLSALEGKSLKLEIDTRKDFYTILYKDGSEWIPHDKFPEPIEFNNSVVVLGINVGGRNELPEKFYVNIRPVGYIDNLDIEFGSNNEKMRFQFDGIANTADFGEIRTSLN